jgi:hypothetical protein
MDILSSLNVTEGVLDLKSSNHEPWEPNSSAKAERSSPGEAEKTFSDYSSPIHCTSRECKIFLILRDFLQPNTSISLSNAVDRVLKEFPVSEDFPVTEDDIFNLACICVELAEQIPYYHSAHEKLARIVCAIVTKNQYGSLLPFLSMADTDIEDFICRQRLQRQARNAPERQLSDPSRS